MPRREDIEKFTQVLNSLGDEPAIRAAHSETIEEVPAPGEETAPEGPDELDTISADDVELPGGPEEGEVAEPAAQEQPPPGGGEESPQDMLSDLSEQAPQPGGSAEEGIDFASLFGEESAQQTVEELERPAAPGRGGPPRPPPPAVQPTDEFALPAGELADLQADLSGLEVLPEEPGAAPAQQGEAEAAPVDFGFEEPAVSETAAPGEGPLESLMAESTAEEPGALETGPREPGPIETGPVEPGPLDLAPLEAGPLDAGGQETSPAAPEEPSFEDFGAFPLEQPGEEMPEPGEVPAPGETPIEAAELPNLDDLSFAEPVDVTTAEAAEAPPEPAAEESPLGGFDLDTFDTSAEALPSAPAEAAPEPARPDLDTLAEAPLGDLNLDEFSLPESAEAFGVTPQKTPTPAARPARPSPSRPAPAAPRREPARPPRPPRAEGEAAAELVLTPAQFAQLKKTLDALPRNLKIVVQDLIGEGTASGADTQRLIDLLLQGASAQEIATLAGRITGKRIRVPAGYEKKTGVAFEAEQRTFAYAFRENIIPLLRVVVLTILVGGLLGFLGYRYVYRPLYAYANYRSGYAQIASDRFALANEKFAAATGVWRMKGWYYRYADAFSAKRQYVLAEGKYDQLLRDFPGDRKGILDYAAMESTKLADYEKADGLLALILGSKPYDYDALLAAGDNDLEWARREQPKYEAARLAYATSIQKYGARDDLLFRMLRYFIRTDNGDEVERLRVYYAQKPEVKVNAPVFAELGGYLVDHRRLDYAQDVLFRADKSQPGLAAVHYNLARYYRIVQSPSDEKKALDVTLRLMSSADPLTSERLSMEIDTHTRLGEYYYRTQDYVSAETDLQTAIRLIEQNQKIRLIGRDPLFGRPYAVLGDLYYYIQGDLPTAAAQYQSAIANLYTSPELVYKIGYIQYAAEDYRNALVSFTSAEDASAYPDVTQAEAPSAALPPASDSAAAPALAGQPPSNLLFALGDCFFQRGDFFAAQGYFLRLLNRLETRRASLGILTPQDRPEQRALLNTLQKVDNNLGVTMVRLAERTGDRRKKSEGMVYLTNATEIASSLARNPDTVQRSEDRNLPSLNMRGILYPVTGFVLQVYKALPKDFQASDW